MPQFEAGNKSAKKNPKVVARKLFEMLRLAKTDDSILSFQDACAKIGWRDSKVNYWCNTVPVFATIKTDIQNSIIARINTGSLTGKFNTTASIWREKQLGEKDVIESKNETTQTIVWNETKTYDTKPETK